MHPPHRIQPAGTFASSRRAFTLMEILVVLAILGLLLGLVATNTDKIFGQGQDVVAKVFVRDTLKSALMRYRYDLGDYPSTEEGLRALMTAPDGKAESWKGPYLEVPGGKMPVDPWKEAYQYRYPGTKNVGSYDLFSKGDDKTPDTADDIGNW